MATKKKAAAKRPKSKKRKAPRVKPKKRAAKPAPASSDAGPSEGDSMVVSFVDLHEPSDADTRQLHSALAKARVKVVRESSGIVKVNVQEADRARLNAQVAPLKKWTIATEGIVRIPKA